MAHYEQLHHTSPAFESLLFEPSTRPLDIDSQREPAFFRDLNLDQIVNSITAGRDEYNLKPFFYAPLSAVEAVEYRYEVHGDLRQPALLQPIHEFAQKMRRMRAHLEQASKLRYLHQQESWFLDAVAIYVDAITALASELAAVDLNSRGFVTFRAFLTAYRESPDFKLLSTTTDQLKADLATIIYSMYIADSRVTVTRYEPEPDYGVDVLATFEKFRQSDQTRDYRFTFSSMAEMNHVEAGVLDFVARLNPDLFARLDKYAQDHEAYLNPTVALFDREIQFYIACHEYSERLRILGLPTCLPEVSVQSKVLRATETFDFALADSLARARTPVVTNDFFLDDPERIIVVSGPNQGGKTTFARTFGQMLYLATVGCPVAGRAATLFVCDAVFTHFEREENIENLSSKLEDDLRRIRAIFERATPASVLIMNESFLSTTVSDASFLSREIMQRVINLDMLCVSVTFLDELATMSRTTVSMVSTIDPVDPARRTFKVVRKPADGLAYANAIAEKYHLTFAEVKQRIRELTVLQ